MLNINNFNCDICKSRKLNYTKEMPKECIHFETNCETELTPISEFLCLNCGHRNLFEVKMEGTKH